MLFFYRGLDEKFIQNQVVEINCQTEKGNHRKIGRLLKPKKITTKKRRRVVLWANIRQQMQPL